MEKEVHKENTCTPLTPDKQNYVTHGQNSINGRMEFNIPATTPVGKAKGNDSNKFQSDENSPFTPVKASSRKRPNSGLDSNKERPKRYRPKILVDPIFVEGKYKRTPKARIPESALHPHTAKPSTPTTKESWKYARGINKQQDTKSCRRSLNFCAENLASRKEKDVKADCIPREATESPLRVYHRRLRIDQFLKNSKILGPNFPKIFKKRMINRKKATGLIIWWSDKTMEVRQEQIKARKLKTTNKVVARKVNVNKIWNGVSKLNLNCSFVKMISPTEAQARVAINDPESFKLVVSLRAIVILKRMRIKGFTQRRKNFTNYMNGQLSATHINNEVHTQKKTRGRPRKLKNDAFDRSRHLSIDELYHFVVNKFKELSIDNEKLD